MNTDKPNNMVCPKCGKFQPKAQECAHCGIIVAKFKEAQAARPEPEAQAKPAFTPRASAPIGLDFGRMARIFAFAVAFGVGWVMFNLYSGDAQYEQLRRDIHTLPAYSEIKQYDPTAFAELERLVEQAQASRAPPERIFRQAQTLIMKSVMRFVPTTSDEAINGFARTYLELTRELEGSDPELCYQLLTQQATLAKTQRAAPEAVQMAVLKRVAEVIRASAEMPQPAPKAARVEPVVNALAQRLSERHGGDLMYIQSPQLAAYDMEKQRKVCAITNDLYDMILAKPPRSSSRVLRHILAQGG